MTVPEPIPFGARVRALRLRQVLTQRELAERAGLNQDTINRIELTPPGTLPRQSTIRKLARALGVKATDLVAPES
jgi:transcriptional regulator with XRE-family HTH domain